MGWSPHVFRVVWSCPGQVPDYFYEQTKFCEKCVFSSQESPGLAQTGPGRSGPVRVIPGMKKHISRKILFVHKNSPEPGLGSSKPPEKHVGTTPFLFEFSVVMFYVYINIYFFFVLDLSR